MGALLAERIKLPAAMLDWPLPWSIQAPIRVGMRTFLLRMSRKQPNGLYLDFEIT